LIRLSLAICPYYEAVDYLFWYLTFQTEVYSSSSFPCGYGNRGKLCTSSRDLWFCRELRSARISFRNVFRITTSIGLLHSGRKPVGSEGLPPRERIADTVRTEAALRISYRFLQKF
jgi:hypothetical protein